MALSEAWKKDKLCAPVLCKAAKKHVKVLGIRLWLYEIQCLDSCEQKQDMQSLYKVKLKRINKY